MRSSLLQGFVECIVRPGLSSAWEEVAERCSSNGSGGPVNLKGFRVELALKNMEYKAVNDSEVEKGTFLFVISLVYDRP